MSPYKILDQQGLNFITCTVVGWIDIFSRKIYRDILLESLAFCRTEKGLLIFAYVVMTNHIHLITQVGPNSKYSLSEQIRDFKKFTANTILEEMKKNKESRREWMATMFKYYAKRNTNNREMQFWQENNHPILLYSNPVIWQKVNYIHENPVRAGFVDKASDYPYSSARNYERNNQNCLIEIDLLEPWFSEVGKIV